MYDYDEEDYTTDPMEYFDPEYTFIPSRSNSLPFSFHSASITTGYP